MNETFYLKDCEFLFEYGILLSKEHHKIILSENYGCNFYHGYSYEKTFVGTYLWESVILK